MQPVRIPRLQLSRSAPFVELAPTPAIRPQLMKHLTKEATRSLRHWVKHPTVDPHQKRIALIALRDLSTEECTLLHQPDFLASLHTQVDRAIASSGLTAQYRLSGPLHVATNGENYGLSEPSEHPGDFVFGTVIDHTADQYR